MMATAAPSLERVRAAFEAVCGPGKSSGQWILFSCLCHDDRHESAAITYNANAGRTVVRCFAGCDDRDLLAAVGLSVRDLYDNPIQPGTRPAHHRRAFPATRPASTARQNAQAAAHAADREAIAQRKAAAEAARGQQLAEPELVICYRYDHADGTPAGTVCRYITRYEHVTEKSFIQRHWDPSRKRYIAGGFDPVLYHLPQVHAAIAAGETIYVVEGEKDADNAITRCGVTATCNAMGAGSFTATHAEQLRGAREVVIVADRDEPGRRHAAKVRELLTDQGITTIRIAEPRTGKDLTDHLDAGHGLEDLMPTTEGSSS